MFSESGSSITLDNQNFKLLLISILCWILVQMAVLVIKFPTHYVKQTRSGSKKVYMTRWQYIDSYNSTVAAIHSMTCVVATFYWIYVDGLDLNQASTSRSRAVLLICLGHHILDTVIKIWYGILLKPVLFHHIVVSSALHMSLCNDYQAPGRVPTQFAMSG